MVYRAKITKIQSWVESHYSITAFDYVRDCKDTYIEVNDPDEAEMLERINSAEEKVLMLKRKWSCDYE